MCGIVGSCGQKYTLQDVQSGLGDTLHRGPDETFTKTYEKYGVHLGMNRLAIRDLQRDLYPFSYKHYTLIFNGEIYNVQALADELGIELETTCDAEIILPLFEKYHTKAFDMLIGMFAIAIYDTEKHILYLIRDKFGEKPLYYSYHEGHVFFSSEMKGFPLSLREVSNDSILRYTVFGYQPSVGSIYSGICKVEPGQYVAFNLPSQSVSRNHYFRYINAINKPKQFAELDQWVAELDKDIQQIVSEKMVSDMPVGLFLSGGVDSSFLAALAQQNSPTKLKTFSIGFKGKEFDESPYAQIVADKIGTDHTPIHFDGKTIRELWDRIIPNLDEPFFDPAQFPVYLMSEYASKEITVVLTGEGADEIFAGYPRYRKEVMASRIRKFTPDILKPLLVGTGNAKVRRAVTPPAEIYTSIKQKTTWLREHTDVQATMEIQATWETLGEHATETRDTITDLQIYDLRYFVAEQLCMKVDKMTMQHSIESRAPFLDARLLAYVQKSGELLRTMNQDKWLLRKVAERYLPHDIVWRNKHGFNLPIDRWLKNELRDVTEQLTHNLHPQITEVIGKDFIENLLKAFFDGNLPDGSSVWNMAVLNSWLHHKNTDVDQTYINLKIQHML